MRERQRYQQMHKDVVAEYASQMEDMPHINGKLVNDFTEEAGRKAGKDFERKLNEGTIAFQAHDPKSVVQYRNVRVKKH